MRNPPRFSVRPRYTAGSPGQVGEELALTIASQEKEDYERCLEGIYGEKQLHRAKELGLRGIVEEMVEHKGGFKVTDLITGEKFWRGNVKPNKVVKGDRLVEHKATVVNALGKHVHFGSTHYSFYTDNRDAGNPNGYRTYNANELVKVERKLPEDC